MTITVLSDNRGNPQAPDLGAEHGLSLFVDTGRGRVLFDAGASDLFARNARLLGIDLAAVDAAILSHGHYDHGGGLPAFLALNARARIHVGPGAFDPHYAAAVGPLRKYVGLDRDCLEQVRGRSVMVDREVQPVAGVFVFPTAGSGGGKPADMTRFTRGTGRLIEPDDFSHELVAVVAGEPGPDGPGGPAGLVVLTGCSHKGILDVVASVKERFPGRQIKAVVGGLHMMNPATRDLAGRPADIEAAGARLRDDSAVHRLYAGHCTGEKAFALLRQVMGTRIEQLAVGLRIDV